VKAIVVVGALITALQAFFFQPRYFNVSPTARMALIEYCNLHFAIPKFDPFEDIAKLEKSKLDNQVCKESGLIDAPIVVARSVIILATTFMLAWAFDSRRA
jgi:hypothetical protein